MIIEQTPWRRLAHYFLSQNRAPRDWYFLGEELYEANKTLAANLAFSRYAKLAGRIDLLSGFQPYGPFATQANQSHKSIRAFFDAKFQAWHSGAIPLPPAMQDVENERPNAHVTSPRLLYFGTEHVAHSRTRIKTPILDHVLGSSHAVGLHADAVYIDDAYTSDDRPDRRNPQQVLRDLFATVDRIRPDVIVFDGNEIRSDAPICPADLKPLRTKTQAKLATFFFDAWTTRAIADAEDWAQVSDVLVHFAPDGPLDNYEPLREKTILAACPLNTDRYHVSEAEKDISYSFIGTTYQHLRPFYLSFLKSKAARAAFPGTPHIHTHASHSTVALTLDQHAEIMRRSKISINLTSRGNGPDDFGVKVLTGRAWHALFSGSLLFEEDNFPITKFLVPYVHYVPFHGVGELLSLLKFFNREPRYLSAIVQNATQACSNYFAPRHFWDRILTRALRAERI